MAYKTEENSVLFLVQPSHRLINEINIKLKKYGSIKQKEHFLNLVEIINSWLDPVCEQLHKLREDLYRTCEQNEQFQLTLDMDIIESSYKLNDPSYRLLGEIQKQLQEEDLFCQQELSKDYPSADELNLSNSRINEINMLKLVVKDYLVQPFQELFKLKEELILVRNLDEQYFLTIELQKPPLEITNKCEFKVGTKRLKSAMRHDAYEQPCTKRRVTWSDRISGDNSSIIQPVLS